VDDVWTLVPVKETHLAKTRLAGVLTAAERRALAWALAERTLQVLADTRLHRIGIVTDDEDVRSLSRDLGFAVLCDEGHDHSAAMREATRWAADRGADGIVTLAADLPLLHVADVVALHELLAPLTLVIAPDRTGRGTNAIAVAPPEFPFAFGPGSRRRHVASARAMGLSVRVLRREGLAVDIDEPTDLACVPVGSRA
jgi:2-phospho-L-lactate guanylyltransferase